MWALAKESIPAADIQGLDVVRRFGEANCLPLLTEREFRASRTEALDVLAIAGRILDAEGVFVAPDGDVTCFFALKSFHVEPSDPAG